MAETAEELRSLEDANRLVARGEALVAEQERRLEQLRKDGHPTGEAAQTLESLKGAVKALRETQRIPRSLSCRPPSRQSCHRLTPTARAQRK
jgi:hypothetical protein